MKTDGGRALSRVAADALPGLRTAQTIALLSVAQAGTRELTLANLVEGAAVGEVLFLRFRPAAELLIDGKQLQFREFVSIFLRHIRIARAVEVLRRNLPGLPASRDTSGTLPPPARAFLIHHFVDHRDGRLSQNRLTWGHDFKLVFAQFVGRQQRFVFPRAISTSPMPRSTKVLVEPRAPESSTSTFLYSALTNSSGFRPRSP